MKIWNNKIPIWNDRLELSQENVCDYLWSLLINGTAIVCSILDYEDVINYLINDEKIILGGKLFFKSGNINRFDGSNWHYNGGSPQESASEAQNYLSKFLYEDGLLVSFSAVSAFRLKQLQEIKNTLKK